MDSATSTRMARWALDVQTAVVTVLNQIYEADAFLWKSHEQRSL